MFLTVIIRVYNREDTIYRCIMSVINQTYIHKLQILIINDCSTDNTISIINFLILTARCSQKLTN